jgi:hypothetical protein
MARSGELAMKKEMPQCLHSLVTVVCEASAVDLARVSAESPAELLNKTVRKRARELAVGCVPSERKLTCTLSSGMLCATLAASTIWSL